MNADFTASAWTDSVKVQCLVFNTNLIILVTKKIGLDVVNLDFIFHVKCDHFSFSRNGDLKMEMQQTFA